MKVKKPDVIMKVKKPDDAAMIRDPFRWPAWPYLPLKRRDTLLENKNLGVILDDGKPEFTVYYVNICELPKGPEAWAKAPQIKYPSVEVLLQDGWMVD